MHIEVYFTYTYKVMMNELVCSVDSVINESTLPGIQWLYCT